MRRQESEKRLCRVAQLQAGFFTASQARLAGYADNKDTRQMRITS